MRGHRMAGVFGLDDDEHAWLYDMDTKVETDIQPLLDENVSWASDIDGELVVGGLETRRTFKEHAFVYDEAAGTATDLTEALDAEESLALAIDGTIVVGWVRVSEDVTAAFAYDHADGSMRRLPGLGSARATGISGNLVVGVIGSTVVVWDLERFD